MADEIRIVVTGEDNASGVLSKIGGALGGVASVAGGILSANLIGGIAGKVKDLAGSMITGNAEFETYQTQFGVLLKSAPAAKERLDELAKFGASTPFELPELVRADKVLTAFGLDSADTAKRFGVSGAQIRTTIGDVASGTGASFEELSVTFGKFASGATGEAIARFQELGIATKEEMASWGLEFSKSGQLLTPTAEAFTILEAHVRTKFGGMMDAQSKTFSGMVSNLQDWMGQTVRTLGAPIFEVVKDKLAGLMEFLGSPAVQTAIQSFADGLAGGIGQAIDWLANTAIPGLTSAWQTIEPVVAPVAAAIAGLFASGDIQGGAQSLLDTLSQISPTFQLLRGVVEAALPPIQSIVESVFGIVAGFIAEHGATIQADLTSAWQGIQGLIDAVLPPIQSIVSTIFGAIAEFLHAHGADIQAFLGTTWDQIASIIGTATQLVQAIVVPIFTAIAGFLKNHGAEIQAILSGAWTIIKSAIDAALTLIQGILKAALQIIQGDWSGAWETIKSTFGRVWEDLKAILRTGWDGLRAIFDTIVAGALALGENIVDGIKRGISGGWQALKDYVGGLASSLLDSAKAALGIKSPSRLFAEQVGRPIAEGIAKGIRDASRTAIDALGDLGQDMAKQLRDLAGQAESLMNDALVGGATGAADIARDRLRVTEDLERLGAAAQQAAQAQLAEAEAQTAQLAQRDPELAAKYYRMRTGQIAELARLQDDLASATDDAERQRIQARLDLTLDAQQKERDAFAVTAQVKGDALAKEQSTVQAAIDAIHNATADIPILGLDDDVAAKQTQIAGLTSRIAAEGDRKKRAKLQDQLQTAMNELKTLQDQQAMRDVAGQLLPGLEATLGQIQGQGAIGDVLSQFQITPMTLTPGSVVVNAAPGQSADEVADLVMQKLAQLTSTRR